MQSSLQETVPNLSIGSARLALLTYMIIFHLCTSVKTCLSRLIRHMSLPFPNSSWLMHSAWGVCGCMLNHEAIYTMDYCDFGVGGGCIQRQCDCFHGNDKSWEFAIWVHHWGENPCDCENQCGHRARLNNEWHINDRRWTLLATRCSCVSLFLCQFTLSMCRISFSFSQSDENIKRCRIWCRSVRVVNSVKIAGFFSIVKVVNLGKTIISIRLQELVAIVSYMRIIINLTFHEEIAHRCLRF